MTSFVKSQFYGSEYVDYNIGNTSKFVARFKYARGSKASFISFLIKNFTVEEYFGRLAAGEQPLTVLNSKGYIQPHIKKRLKELGYEVSAAGFEKLIQDQVNSRNR